MPSFRRGAAAPAGNALIPYRLLCSFQCAKAPLFVSTSLPETLMQYRRRAPRRGRPATAQLRDGPPAQSPVDCCHLLQAARDMCFPQTRCKHPHKSRLFPTKSNKPTAPLARAHNHTSSPLQQPNPPPGSTPSHSHSTANTCNACAGLRVAWQVHTRTNWGACWHALARQAAAAAAGWAALPSAWRGALHDCLGPGFYFAKV
jgi:hypothetical protein